MSSNQYWEIFKKTGNIEAYLTYSCVKSALENTNVKSTDNKGSDIKNK